MPGHPRASLAGPRPSARPLVDRQATAATAFGAAPRDEKRRLLEQVARVSIRPPRALLRFHETLLFLRAYPDDPEVLAGVERALHAFPARVARLAPAALARLRDSGIAGTRLDYPFGFPMARWLGSRFPGDVDVRWKGFAEGEALEEALAFLVTPTESEAFSEGGLGWRRWLRVARGRRWTDFQVIMDLFGRAPLPEEARDRLFESLGLSIEWRLRPSAPSRTLAYLPGSPICFHGDGLRRGPVDLGGERGRPSPTLRRATRPRAEEIIETARAAMATRQRELYAFSHANPDDVLVADPAPGLRVALVGLRPESRLPLEAYYAFLALKNGVPVCYGGGWGMFGTLEFALNVFESFRRGESAWMVAQILRVYRQVFRVRAVVVDRSQIGGENTEALRSGAFYFYTRLGFRPRDPVVDLLWKAEAAKIALDRSYRSSLAVLRRLGRSDLLLTLGARPAPVRVSGSDVAALVTRRIAREFEGDRRAATRIASGRLVRTLGARGWRAWPADERRAFERLSVLADAIPDLGRWPAAERLRLAEVLRARGGPSEVGYLRRLDGHRRFRRALEGLRAAARS